MFGVASVATAQSRNTENTLKLDDPNSRPTASFEDVAWMVGSWQGEGFGGAVEEEWQAASGGTMAGVFKLMHEGRASMYEFMMIAEEGDSLEMRLKHFDADFSAWEDKAEYVSFPLVRLSEDSAYFDGLTYRRDDRDRMIVHVSIGEEKEEATIEFVRRESAVAPAGPSPYAGMEDRPIKALSQDEIAGYRAGEGMGFAMAAELNGYPGPKHVLELESELELTPDQAEATQAAFDEMHGAAVALGERLVEAEESLDRLFAGHQISGDTLEETTSRIARLSGELRAVHLEAHLRMVEILTPEQRHAYMSLRGYGEGAMPAGHHPGMHHAHGN
jgi:Spy/CpxP family protein refolding chaperone